MASLAKSENNSLRYHYLDNGVNNESRNMPMAAADFGAESGAYFLKSTPLDTYPEYKIEPDPRCGKDAAGLASMESLVVEHAPEMAKKSKRRKKHRGRVVGAQVESTTQPETCATVRWETLPGCLVKTVIDVTGDLTDKLQGSRVDDGLVSILTRQNRLIYLSILFLLLYFVYRILRRC